MSIDRRSACHPQWTIAFCLYFALLIAIIASAYLRLIPTQLKTVPFYDTIGHFVLLGIASYLGHLALRQRTVVILTYPIALSPLLITCLTTVEEALQYFSSNRTVSFSDWAASVLGVWCFYWIAHQQFKRRVQSDR